MKQRRIILRFFLIGGIAAVLLSIRLSQPASRFFSPASAPQLQPVALPGTGPEDEEAAQSGGDDDKTFIHLQPSDPQPDPLLPIPYLFNTVGFEPEDRPPHTASPDPEPLQKPRYPEPDTQQAAVPVRNRREYGQRMIGAFPLLFDGQEGSASDLTTLFGDGPFRVDMRSDWMTRHLTSGRNIPSLRMRILQDPFTGEYRISGGAVALPATGLEAGYETESGTEGYKATLQWKKAF